MNSLFSNFDQKLSLSPFSPSYSEELVFAHKQDGTTGNLESIMDLYLQMPSVSLAPHSNSPVHGKSDENCGIPIWTNDSSVGISLKDILQKGFLIPFAKERLGSQRLQQLFPSASAEERLTVIQRVIEDPAVFIELSCDLFGNHFVQKVMESSTFVEQCHVARHLKQNIFHMCCHRFGSRVLQKALDVLSGSLKLDLIAELAKTDVVSICVGNNGNYVIQKIMTDFPVSVWSFLVEVFVSNEKNFFKVMEHRFGCIVVQVAIEKLSNFKDAHMADGLLKRLMNVIIEYSMRLIYNEWSNYVIQFIVGCQSLGRYRDFFIENCLLRNLLSMAQDKHASHVVEKAFQHAPPALIDAMMDEIIDGYQPHPETGKDALDIMMFNPYGNYIVQEMLKVCVEAARVYRSGQTLDDMEQRLIWLSKLSVKIFANESRLVKYNSGKKMIEMLAEVSPTLRSHQLRPFGFEQPCAWN